VRRQHLIRVDSSSFFRSVVKVPTQRGYFCPSWPAMRR
jgi:hypothetical protein